MPREDNLRGRLRYLGLVIRKTFKSTIRAREGVVCGGVIIRVAASKQSQPIQNWVGIMGGFSILVLVP